MNDCWNTVVEDYGFLLSHAKIMSLHNGERSVDAEYLDLSCVSPLELQLTASVRLHPSTLGQHETLSFLLQDREGNVLCRCEPPEDQETEWTGSSVAEELCRLGEQASGVAYLLVIAETTYPSDYPSKRVCVYQHAELLLDHLENAISFWKPIVEMKK